METSEVRSRLGKLENPISNADDAGIPRNEATFTRESDGPAHRAECKVGLKIFFPEVSNILKKNVTLSFFCTCY